MAAGDVTCGCKVCVCPNTRSSRSLTPECYLCSTGVHKVKPTIVRLPTLRYWERPNGAFSVDCRCRDWKPRIIFCRQLTQAEEDEADVVGTQMWRNAIHAKDSVQPKPEDERLKAHIIGARGEMSWGIGTGTVWMKRVDAYKDEPDFDPDIEVRVGGQGYPNMVMRSKEIEAPGVIDRRFVGGVLYPNRTYNFHAWARPREFLAYPKSDPGGKGSPERFLHFDDMHRFPFHD